MRARATVRAAAQRAHISGVEQVRLEGLPERRQVLGAAVVEKLALRQRRGLEPLVSESSDRAVQPLEVPIPLLELPLASVPRCVSAGDLDAQGREEDGGDAIGTRFGNADRTWTQ